MRKFVLSVFAILLLSVSLLAQDQRVSGTVTAEDGSAIAGVTVIIKGTSHGTITNTEGKYSMVVPKDGTLAFSFVGMQSKDVSVAGKTVVDTQLKGDALGIDGVVVTAMGITRAEKTLGYAATTVSNEELTKSRNSDVLSSLSGKIAGVQVSTTSSDPGATNSVMIRGVSSLTSGNNQPLFIVDGVPLVNNVSQNSLSDRGTYSYGNGANMVSPDDVQSMTVLKGAAATAIYGSRAAGGVIIITTKSGSKSSKLSIDVNSGIQVSSISVLPEFQNMFGQGWNGLTGPIENGSWGPRFDNKPRVYGHVYENTQQLKNYSALPNNIKDFFETGVMYSNSVSLAGGSEKTTYYTSFSHVSDNGMLPGDNDSFKKTTIAFRGSHDFKDWLSVSSSVNVANQHNKFAIGGQGVTMIDGLYETPRDISIVDLKDLNNPFNQPGYYYTPYGITNPYFALENNQNDFLQKKIFGKAQLDITPIDNLKLTYRFGFDYTDSEKKLGTPRLDLTGTPNVGINQDGSVEVEFARRYEINNDFLANYNKTFESIGLELTATAGVNINERSMSLMNAKVTGLTIPTFYDLSNSASTPTIFESAFKRRLIGVFGDVQLGYKQLLYLTLTARNDWSSTLPLENNSFFYPGVTGSFIFTELLPKNDVLSFGKVRLAWGKTGNDADVYQTLPYFVQGYANNNYSAPTSFPIGGLNAFRWGSRLGSLSLQPEMTSETEVGLNLLFFKGRIGIDAAYYKRVSDQQIFNLDIDPATGYTSQTANLGRISNRGIELLLTTTPIQTRDFRWDFNVNFTRNRSLVESLPTELGGIINLNQYTTTDNAVYMRAEEGQPIGTFWTYSTLRDPNGNIVVSQEDGLPVKDPTLSDSGFDMNHKWEMGVNTSFSYKGITLGCDFDIRYGGHMFSRTKDLMAFTGNSITTIYNDRYTYIIPGSVNKLEDGTFVENTTPIASGKISDGQVNLANGYDGDRGLLMDRSFVKLRNLTISYDLPQKWVSKIYLKSVRISAVGNNLFVWTPTENVFIDPESTTEGYDLSAKFGEMYANPASRRIGFNVQIKF